MERYKFTFADGSSTDEFFESDNEAIVAATAANGGSSWGLYVQRYDHRGSLLPTKLPPGGHRGTWCPHIGMPSPALVVESAVDAASKP
ncbi:hypothetical protein EU244_030860 [Rhodococcus qingshengii]|uniref:hypothetical protein n=1 Tax=Rhodococcus qingshengii TaxID=334542 RepID=UPI0010A5D8F4|nr:hypothetical protein [Rhodococcus qingshengii]THJ65705.1 hypothetical protein EU244_28860 [Rhodococcus qingshengii]